MPREAGGARASGEDAHPREPPDKSHIAPQRCLSTRGAEPPAPPHPVHLTSLSPQHIPHLAPEHTPRGCPATARPAPRGEADGDGHGRMLPQGQLPGTHSVTPAGMPASGAVVPPNTPLM